MDNLVKIIKIFILGIALFALCSIFFDYGKAIYDGYMKEYKGTETVEGVDVEVEIPEGASVKQIAKILKEKGLIQYEMAFTSRLKNSEYRGNLHHGTYTLNTGMSTLDMMAVMSYVPDVEKPIDKLVVPEGFTIEQIAARCEKQGICSSTEFLNAVNSVTSSEFPYLSDVPSNGSVKYKLQGFLFPATYDVYQNTTAEDLVNSMLEAFDYYFTDELKAIADEKGYTVFEVITRASIIEREASIDDERPIIAGVINNRLSAGMPLQMCPTVLYPLTDGLYDQEQVYYEDLELESPYNTYKYEGLPVGPICNPGVACIYAVLHPETHNYYYYHVSDEDDGRHIFTETYEEHVDTQIIGGPNGVEEGNEEDNNEE